MSSPTRNLAEFVAGLRFEHLPDAVVRQASDVALDTLGCCVNAWEQDARIVNETYSTVTTHFSKKIVNTVGSR
jgi:2-methylcitrate dehydratase PrpD